MGRATHWLKPLLDLANAIGSGRRGKKSRSAVRANRRIRPFLEMLECRIVPSGSDVFLKGNYVEVGVNAIGSFGTTSNAPTGFYPRPGNGTSELGFVADPNKTGWTNYYGDYFLPGSPEENFAVQWGATASPTVFCNDTAGSYSYPSITTTSTANTTLGSTESAVWAGTAKSGSSQLQLTQTVSFGANDLWFVMNVVLTNTGTTTLQNVEYSRNVDPDNEYTLTGNYNTDNYVVAQPPHAGVTTAYPTGNTDEALVVATGPEYTSDLLGLGTFDPRATVSVGGFSNQDPNSIIDQSYIAQLPNPVMPTPTKQDLDDDVAISLGFSLGTLAPGQSTSLDYAYILATADLATALASFSDVKILQPSGTVSGSNVSFQATTNNPSSATTSVAFKVNGTSIGTVTTPDKGGVYSETFDSTAFPNGPLSLEADATFADGTTASSISSVTVSNSGPPISITTPTPGQVFSGSGIPISVTATSSSDLPVRVDFFRQTSDTGTISLGEVTGSSPFVSSFSVTDLPLNDTVNITAVATDSMGRTTTVTVTGTKFNNQPPTIAANSSSVSVVEGVTATNTGTFNDLGGDSTATLTASMGTVTQNDTTGTWSWSLPTSIVIAAQPVTITATDTAGSTAAVTFTLVATDAPLTDTTPVATYNVVAGGGTGQLVIATFSDGNPSAVVSEYTPVVNWGGTVLGTPAVTIQQLSATSTASTWEVLAAATYTLSGTHAVTVKVNDSGGQSVATSNTSVTVAPALAATLSFPSQPVSTTAGIFMSPVVVQAVDQYGNLVPGASITLSIPSGTLNGTLTATTSASGQATFSGLSDNIAGTYTLTAKSGSVSAASSSFTIGAAAATTLSFTTPPPASIIVNTTFAPVVLATDVYGNAVPNAGIALVQSAGTLNGTKTLTTDATGKATFSGLSMSTVGAGYTLTASSSTLTTQSTAFNVTPAALAVLSFTVQPASTTAGSTLGLVTLKATDTYGNVISGASIGVSLTSGTLNGTTPLSTSAGLAVFSDLSINLVGTYTLKATSGTITTTSTTFTISPAAAATLAYAPGPTGTTTAGKTLAAVNVKVTDQFNNLVPNVAVTLTPSASTLGGAASVLSNAAGIASFTTLSMTTAGTYTLTASATGPASMVSGTFIIAPAAATQLLFTTEPANVIAGNALPVAIEALDSFGNTVPGVNISSLTLAPAKTLNNFAAQSTGATGLATFGGLSVDLAGTYTMTAGSTSLNATSTSFIISPAAVAKISFFVSPGTTTAGSIIGPVTAQASDAYGNAVPGTSISMALAGGSFASGTTTVVTNSAGQAVFSNLITNTAGTYTLSMSTANLASVSSTSFKVNIASPTLSFTTQPVNASLGTAMRTVTVHLADKYGNAVVGATVNLALSSGNLVGTVSVATDPSGLANFNALTILTAGTGDTLMATASGAPAVASNAFNILAMPASHLAFVGQPNNAAAGGNLGQITVFDDDANGNPVIGAPVTISASAGALFGALSVVTDSSGLATFSTLSENAAGTFTLKAVSATVTATSGTYAITAAAPARITFSTGPANTNVGTTMRTVTVLAVDRYGNPASGAVVNLVLSSGTLNGTTYATSGANGLATFNTLSIQPAGVGYSLTATATGLASVKSTSFSVLALPVASLTFITQPANPAAGTNLGAVTVQADDLNGNPVIGAQVTINIAPGKLTGMLSAVTNSAGLAIFSALAETAIGTFTLKATSHTTVSALSSSFTIMAAAAAKMTIVSQPATTTAGPIKTVTVLVTDKYGNAVSGTTVNIGLASGNLTSGTRSLVTDGSGHAAFNDLVEDTAGACTLIATSSGLANVATGLFIIKPAAASQLVFLTQTSNGKAGASLAPFTIEALDTYGNVVTTAGTAITLTDGTLTKGPYLTNTTGKVIVTNWAENVAGAYSLYATATGLTPAMSNGLTIVPGAGILGFASPPANTTAGNDLGPVTVRVADIHGNGLPNITVTISITPGKLSNSAQTITTLTTDSTGTVVFDPLAENVAGTYALAATAPGIGTLKSKTFTISAGAAATLAFLTQPLRTVAGNKMSAVTVQYYDAFGNAVTTAGTSVTVSTSSGAVLGGTTTATTTAQGRASFSGLSETLAGTYTLQATDGTLTGQSNAFVISAGPVSALTFVFEPNDSSVGGNLGTVMVQVNDANSNPLTGQTVSISLTGATTSLSGTTTAVTDASGDASFDNLSVTKAGTFTLTVFSGGKVATSSSFTIS